MSRPLVLLVYGRNFPYPYDRQTPLGLFSLGAALEGRGFEVAYFDERAEPYSLYAALLRRGPLLVGCSVMGGYQLESARRLTLAARRLAPAAKIAWGGILPSALPAEALIYGGADYALAGEAEETLAALCAALAAGSDPAGLPGLARLADGRARINAPAAAPAAAALPAPYPASALPLLEKYFSASAVREAVGYETSRGCAYDCAFCYSGSFHGAARVKPLPQIERDLAALKALGAERLDIYDDLLMGGDPAGIEALAAVLARQGFKWSANLRIELVTEPLLKLLAAAGCEWLYFGLESDDAATLERLGKGFGPADMQRGLQLLRGSAIAPVFSIITGLPGEKPGAAGQAVALAQKIHALLPRAEIQLQSYVPLPGSRLYAEALAAGWRPPAGGGWGRHDHFSVSLPWLADPALPRRLYLSSFLAWRYERHLSRFPLNLVFGPLQLLSLWRLRRGCFAVYIEGALYAAALRLFSAWRALAFALWNLKARR